MSVVELRRPLVQNYYIHVEMLCLLFEERVFIAQNSYCLVIDFPLPLPSTHLLTPSLAPLSFSLPPHLEREV